MRNDKPIGIFDSGLGGLTVLRELQTALPGESFVYFGDTGRTPYGSKGKETIVRYSLEALDLLLESEVKLVVVACNTASALALGELASRSPVPVIGTVAPILESLQGAGAGASVAVLGTEATIGSGVYQREIGRAYPTMTVTATACPLFVPFVEHGLWEGSLIEQVVDFHLAAARSAEPDVVVLGCTHYPLLAPVLSGYFGERSKLIECSRAVAHAAARALEGTGRSKGASAGPRVRYIVSDEPSRFSALVRRFLGDSADLSVRSFAAG